MKVKMLVNTSYQGAKLKGKEYDVPKDVAERWHHNKIAEVVKSKDKEADKEEELEGQLELDDYDKMSAKDLYELAVEQGLDVEQKKSKKYYTDALNSL